uniref:Tumor protein p53-inducible nuclear protein 1 n=1 Tax=Timema shepardi TaxID=629360 RepID=A0A7R9AUD1_TIMSH|nr:unnamed protein product [Timema shepardi]
MSKGIPTQDSTKEKSSTLQIASQVFKRTSLHITHALLCYATPRHATPRYADRAIAIHLTRATFCAAQMYNGQLRIDNMFTSLANYLRGGESSRDVAGTVTTDVRFTAVEAGDDWLLVDRATDSRSSSLCDTDLEDETDCDCRSLEVVISAIPAPSPATRTSSASSLPCLSLEESWFVTPPPCFTSEGPVHMETSPFENLLIEHPSMSVYQHSSSPVTYVPLRESQSAPSSPAAPLEEEEDEVPPQDSTPAPAPSGRRQAVYSLHQQQERQCIQIRSAQKIYQRRSCQSLKRNHLDRSNKAREINSRNKLKRRSDHMLNHSGANNNRKC